MRLSKLYSKCRKGETLTDLEVDILAKKLGLKDSFFSLAYKIIMTILIAFIEVFCLIQLKYLVLKIIISILLLVFLIFVFVYKNNSKKIISYLEVLKDFYIERLCEYEGFENMFVEHQFMKNGYLQNNLAIIASDGYDFYIFDDLLKETKYLLPSKFKSPNNKRPALKIFDSEFVRKRPVCFHVNEISYYKLLKPYIPDLKEEETYGYEYRRYTYTPTSNRLDNYCLLELEDGSTFKLAPEAIMLLRKKAKQKERE
jgi:hypothetical protein